MFPDLIQEHIRIVPGIPTDSRFKINYPEINSVYNIDEINGLRPDTRNLGGHVHLSNHLIRIYRIIVVNRLSSWTPLNTCVLRKLLNIWQVHHGRSRTLVLHRECWARGYYKCSWSCMVVRSAAVDHMVSMVTVAYIVIIILNIWLP
jgi:hypothetical protein